MHTPHNFTISGLFHIDEKLKTNQAQIILFQFDGATYNFSDKERKDRIVKDMNEAIIERISKVNEMYEVKIRTSLEVELLESKGK